MPEESNILSDGPSQSGPKVFATTHWSVVLAAKEGDSSSVQDALEKLCRTYWYPIYAYLRRRGCGEHDAQDLTQGFFAQLLERRSIQGVEREKGKFRSFLLASLKYFLADERDRANAQKRGGGRAVLSLDAQEAEQRYRLEPVDERSPERIFEHRWAMALLDQVLARLGQEFADAVKRELFERLQAFLVEDFCRGRPGSGHDGGGGEEGGAADAAPLSSAFPRGDSADGRQSGRGG